MAILTAKQFIESLRDNRVVYFEGKRVEDVTQHPIFKLSLNSQIMDYTIIEDSKYRSIFVDKDENGKEVRFLNKPERSAEDLLRRRDLVQLLMRIGFGMGGGGASSTGKDALNAITLVCDRMDRKIGSKYSERVESYRRHLENMDPAVMGAVTDVKGDRSLHPSQQVQHRDFYVRVVDRRKDGIIVRGAKAHISQAPVANEIMVLPCRRHREEDKDYAVAFAVPVNAPGITMISSHHEPVELGNEIDFPLSSLIYCNDSVVVFDDVFIPMERIFLDGEWKFSGDIAYAFGNSHRLFADAYKYVHLEMLAGAAALMAEYNGLMKIPHIQEKLSWLTMYCETVGALGEQACIKAVKEPGSDLAFANPVLSNMCKYYFADNFHLAVKHLYDIAGGLVTTVPSAHDFINHETGPMLEKYLAGKAGVPTEHRIRLMNLVRDMTSNWHQVATLHAEGSLAAQRISIFALADFERYKAGARRLIRIKKEDEHPLYKDLPEFPAKLDY